MVDPETFLVGQLEMGIQILKNQKSKIQNIA